MSLLGFEFLSRFSLLAREFRFNCRGLNVNPDATEAQPAQPFLSCKEGPIRAMTHKNPPTLLSCLRNVRQRMPTGHAIHDMGWQLSAAD